MSSPSCANIHHDVQNPKFINHLKYKKLNNLGTEYHFSTKQETS